jgi:asparagine synthase (glutamine-hydrolysing)
MSARTGLGVADSFQLHGLGKHFREAVRDAAFLTGQAYFQVLTSALSASLNRKRAVAYAIGKPKFGVLSETALFPDLPHYILPPWCAASQQVPPGKRYQILQLAEVLNRHRPLYDVRELDELHPLLSQPLLEVALRIPLHLLQTGGMPRGLARHALRHLVPTSILSRELKGHTSSYILGLINSSLPFVRQLLLEGSLVKRGILAPDALTRHLDAAAPQRAQVIFPLLAAIAAELWVCSWEGIGANRSRVDGRPERVPMSPIEHSELVGAPSSPVWQASSRTRYGGPRD